VNLVVPIESVDRFQEGTESVVPFFALTYLASWPLFALAALVFSKIQSGSSGVAPIGGLLFLPGTIVPSLVAIGLSARANGRTGVADLLRGIAKWRLPLKWYLFALSYMALIKLTSALMYRVVRGEWPVFGQVPWYLLALAIVFSTPVQAGEEIGWRAYALPRLVKQVGLGWASVILGVVWACWHLPFFFIPGSDNFGRSFPLYLLAVTAISVAMTWLYWRTRGSLLLIMLMHASINNSAGIVESRPSGTVTNPFSISASFLAWATVVLLWLWAALLLAQMHRTKLPSDERCSIGGSNVS
jgi:hypothetical protein